METYFSSIQYIHRIKKRENFVNLDNVNVKGEFYLWAKCL